MSKLFELIGNEQRFCCWGPPDGVVIKTKDDKLVGDKSPIAYNASYAIAWSKPKNWITQAQAREGMTRYGRKGIGMFTSNGDCPHLTPITTLDLDHCVENGVIVGEWQREVVAITSTHTRISPSGTGLHLHFIGVDGFVAPEIASTTTDSATGLTTQRPYECYSKAHHIRIGPAVLSDVELRPMTRELWDMIAPLLPGWLDEQQREARALDAPAVARNPVKRETKQTVAGQLSAKQIAFVANAYNAGHSVASELTRNNYTVTGSTVTRPNKDTKAGHSGDIRNGAYLSFSSNDELKGAPGEPAHTAFSVFAHFDYGGDEQAAAWAAAAELGIELHVKGERAAAKGAADNTPTHDELAQQWLDEHPQTCYGLGEFRRYAGGCWNLLSDSDAECEILDVLIRNKQTSNLKTNAYMLKSVKKLAQLLSLVSDKRFDADYNLFACGNGTLDITTRVLRNHSPDDYLLSRVEYDYDPAATAPTWLRVMDESAPVGTRDFLQEFAGYAFTTATDLEVSAWLVGRRGSGKSTIIEGFMVLLGSRYGILSLKQIEKSSFGLGGIIGKTLLLSTEQSPGYIRETGTVNQIISGEPVTIDRKFREPVEYRSCAKILWAMNSAPRVADPEDGIFRRAKIIKFATPKWPQKDTSLKARLRSEGAGILNWALDGLDRLRKRGDFEITDEIKRASAEYERDNDIAGTFVSECCLLGDDLRAQSSLLYESYKTWCLATGHLPSSSTTMAAEWERLGFVKIAPHNVKHWLGVGLKARVTF